MILAFLYSRNYFTAEGVDSLCNMTIIFGVILTSQYVLRSIGRAKNKDYKLFIERYHYVNRPNVEMHVRQKFLDEFDFKINEWMPDYVSTVKPNLQ